MANRLSKITTRTGDDGSTGLGDGSRIHKSALRVQVMGDIDELNSNLGVLAAEPMSAEASEILAWLQNRLFDLGGEICIPGHQIIEESQLLILDNAIADMNARLKPLKEFILPGGTRAAALCHVARTVARRAERSLAALSASDAIAPAPLKFLNRASDFLFVLARTLNVDAGVADVCWEHKRQSSPKAVA